ncbi:hypothetical protein [Rosenbergiella nectarea]|uniref:hypothetical protein n=1 Tax=Rosenbergiella nectarea TaxID=988801 RepID=UPI001F4E7FA3|nr:hypothetical protein [Rosenbergiella nectarea]
MQGMLNKLITGKLSLPKTFWGWGFCGGFLLNLIGSLGIYTDSPYLLPISYCLREILLLAVCSGLIFQLKYKIRFWGVLALVVIVLELIAGIIMMAGLFSLLFQ